MMKAKDFLLTCRDHLPFKEFLLKRRSHLSYFIFFSLMLWLSRFWGAIYFPLNDSTEARYGEMARKMVETGNWLTPQAAYGVPYWGKPPLAFWLSAFGIKLLGPTQLAPRLFIFIAGSLFVVFLYFFVRRFFSRPYALLSSFLLLASVGFYISLAAIETDLILTICVAGAILSFWARLKGASWRWELAIYVFAGLSLLAKGPIGLIFIGVPILGWALLRGMMKDVWGRFKPVIGVAFAVAIAAPWYILAELKTPGFWDYFFIGEHVKRFLVPGWTGDRYGTAHIFPHGTIWAFLLLNLLPWCLLIPPFFIRRKPFFSQVWSDHKEWIILLLLWAFLPILFFTFAANIIWPYALPALPPFILLTALFLSEGLKGDSQKRKVWLMGVLGFGSLAVSLVFVCVTISRFNEEVATLHTQKYIVQSAMPNCPRSSCSLLYWGSKEFSSDYYSQGRATVVDNAGAVLRFEKKGIVYIVVKGSQLDNFERENNSRFVLQKHIGSWFVFRSPEASQ